jgi:hypothetical protein
VGIGAACPEPPRQPEAVPTSLEATAMRLILGPAFSAID